MHKIQEDLQAFKEMTDDDLVNTVLTGWEIVCEENELHRHMVLEREYAQWQEFRTTTSERMFKEISGFGETLEPEARSFFEYMAKQMVAATHKGQEELAEEAEERSRLERQIAINTKVQEADKKTSWLKRVTKWLTRDKNEPKDTEGYIED